MKFAPAVVLTLVALCSLLATGCSKSQETASAAVAEFRGRGDRHAYSEIYGSAAPEFRSMVSETDFTRYMEAVGRKQGGMRTSGTPSWRVNWSTAGTTVAVRYDSQFEKGPAREDFLWRIEHGRAVLLAYRIDSALLIAD